MKVLFTVLAMTLLSVELAAQDGRGVDTADVGLELAPTNDYRLELHVIGGIGGTLYSDAPSKYSERNAFFGYNFNVRLMWHPNHLLSAGFMSGYQVFSTQKFDSGDSPEITEPIKMELNSVPFHIAFEVRPLDIRFGAGIGFYLLQSQIKESTGITHSSDLAYGGSAWVGYTFALDDRLRIGPDLVLQIVSDRGIANLSAMVTLQYDLLVY